MFDAGARRGEGAFGPRGARKTQARIVPPAAPQAVLSRAPRVLPSRFDWPVLSWSHGQTEA